MTSHDDSAVVLLLSAKQQASLDEIARRTERDRAAVLVEAVEAYLDLHQWQTDHIREGLRQAEAGEFASDEEVRAAFAEPA